MEIKICLEIHAYARERLCDRYFDDAPFYGINGPEVMFPLSQKRGYTCSFQYDATTCVGEVIDFIKMIIWGSIKDDVPAPVSYSFLCKGERYYVHDGEHNFLDLLTAYFDPNGTGIVTVCILVSCDAGEVATEKPLRFFVRSHEAGSHHEPHIHVCDTGHEYEASVRISDGEVIAGKLPRQYAKLAKKKILSDQAYFYHCWNTMTDGLQVDINRHYGYIQY